MKKIHHVAIGLCGSLAISGEAMTGCGKTEALATGAAICIAGCLGSLLPDMMEPATRKLDIAMTAK